MKESFGDVIREAGGQRRRQLDQVRDPENGSAIERDHLSGHITAMVGEVATNVTAAVEIVAGSAELIFGGLRRGRKVQAEPRTQRNAWLD